MERLTIGAAARGTGWSPRMLRYLEETGLVVPTRTGAGYRVYGPREVHRLRSLADLRKTFGVKLDDVAFAARLRREPALRAAVDSWLTWSGAPASTSSDRAWIDWEQHKHERLLAA